MARKKISASDKPSRRDELDPSKDQFINKTMTLFDWAYERRRPIFLALGAVLVAAIIGIGVDQLLEDKRVEASGSLAKGLASATAPVVPAPEDGSQLPPKDEDALTFETLKARATATLKDFEETLGRNEDSTKTFAELGKAAAKYDLGEFDEAAKGYSAILTTDEGNIPWVRQAATEGLGLALEAGGKTGDAKKQFESLLKDNNPMVANTARYHVGRLALKEGDKDKATELLTQVLDSYTESGKLSRFDYIFVQSRETLLALNPEADVPAVPGAGLDNIDPRLLQQMIQARAGGGAS